MDDAVYVLVFISLVFWSWLEIMDQGLKILSWFLCPLKCYKDLHPCKLWALIGFKCERVNGSGFDPDEITGHSGSPLSHCECRPSSCWILISDAVLSEVPTCLQIYLW